MHSYNFFKRIFSRWPGARQTKTILEFPFIVFSEDIFSFHVVSRWVCLLSCALFTCCSSMVVQSDVVGECISLESSLCGSGKAHILIISVEDSAVGGIREDGKRDELLNAGPRGRLPNHFDEPIYGRKRRRSGVRNSFYIAISILAHLH